MANKFYGATSLTGSANGSLDSIDGALLVDGDGAFVINTTDNILYIYMLDATSGAAEASPNVVAPDSELTGGGNKRWLLVDLSVTTASVLSTLTVNGATTLKGAITVGVAPATGVNITIYSNTAGDTIVYDATAKTWTFTDIQVVANSVDINGGTISGVTIDGALTWSNAQDLNSQALTNVNIDTGDIATGVTINITDAGGYYAGTQVETILQEIGLELLQHKLNGFEDASTVALSSDGATPPEITLTFTGTVAWWSDGIRYTDSGTDAVSITDANGLHVIYYNGATLTVAANPSESALDALMISKALVAMVYWNANSSEEVVLANELHGLIMSGETHHWLHDNIGARFKSGGTLSGYTLNSPADADISFDITDIEFYDEDIEITITDGVAANQYEQVLTGDAEIPVLYLDAVDQTWAQEAASTLPYAVGATPRIQYMNPAASYALTEVGNTQYCNYFLVATNDWQYPIKMVPGTAVYANALAANTGGAAEIAELADLPSAEFVVLYRFLMHDSAGGTTDAEIISITDYRAESFSGGSVAIPATDHGSLSGLSDDDHAQYVLADGSRALGGAWNMGSQNLTNVDIDSGTIDGVTIFATITGKTGSDVTVVTGTAGTTQVLAMWNADGDIVDASGEIALPDALQLKMDSAPASDETGTGITIDATVDQNTYGIAGLLVLSSDGNWDDADADAEATVGQLAIALEAGTGTKALLLFGIMRDDTFAFTPGAQLYVSGTAGEITETAPIGSGDFVQVVGFALTADVIFFNPSPDYLEIV